jgi:hypothetical protein
MPTGFMGFRWGAFTAPLKWQSEPGRMYCALGAEARTADSNQRFKRWILIACKLKDHPFAASPNQ